jgi:predicted dehydrogenase
MIWRNNLSLKARFKGGPVATVGTASAANMDKGDGIILFGQEGELKLDRFTFYGEQEERQVAMTHDLPRQGSDFVDGFLTACLQNGSPKTPGEDGLKVTLIISMAYLSSKLCREVTLRDLKESKRGG